MKTIASRGRLRLQRHARNSIAAALVIVAASFGGLGWANAALGPWLRDPLYADKETDLRRRIAAAGATTSNVPIIVMFGSSRTANGLQGGAFEAAWRRDAGAPVVAFNFGVPSCGPVTQWLHLRRLLQSGFRPTAVFLEVMPPLLAGQTPTPPEQHFHAPERLLPDEVDVVIAHGYPEHETRGRSDVSNWLPIYGLRLQILGRGFPKWSPWHLRCDSSRNSDGSGWLRPVFDSISDEQRRIGVERARSEYADLLRSLRLNGPATEAIGEAVAACRHAGVPIVLVLMPEGRAFREMYSPQARRAVDQFVLDWQSAVPVIDAREWLDDDAFSDSHHLLASGAESFSRRLAAESVQMDFVRRP